MLSHFAPKSVKFSNKKSLKNQKLYNQKVCVEPETGIVLPVITGQDFKIHNQLLDFVGIIVKLIHFGIAYVLLQIILRCLYLTWKLPFEIVFYVIVAFWWSTMSPITTRVMLRFWQIGR